MKYIVYGYKSMIYAIPAWDEKELEAAADAEKESGGEFHLIGEFTATADVGYGRKWYGVRSDANRKVPVLSLLKSAARNADYL